MRACIQVEHALAILTMLFVRMDHKIFDDRVNNIYLIQQTVKYNSHSKEPINCFILGCSLIEKWLTFGTTSVEKTEHY